VLAALCIVAMGALGGAGDTRFVMWASILGTWGVLVPLGWWLGVACGYGAAGVWAAVTVEVGLRAALCARRWLGGRWQDKAVVAAEKSG
jgi:Na+-driven multidrug efflux pump